VRRPTSLQEVVATSAPTEILAGLREFLDEFYGGRHPRQAMLDPEPAPTGDALVDAHLAAAAEHLARVYGLEVPPWAGAPSRFLARPHVAGPPGMAGIYLVESPLAYRRRNLFVGHDPLPRPRRREPYAAPTTWWAQPPDGAADG
jgi:hypothetical protein